jgi:protocatechuate 3,4-dioxygenase beta subunit
MPDDPTDRSNYEQHRFDRRTALRATGGGGLGLLTAGLFGLTSADDEEAWAADTAAACTLTPEQTEGPYYVDLGRIRSNVKEGRSGLRLRLRVAVVNTQTCARLPDAAVDIWHCDAVGDYSGVGDGETTFLRGIQLTNANGLAFFETIYPGWYRGRATHIHVKVHVGGTSSGGSYSGGNVSHTGQIFFPDGTTDAVMRRLPYRRHTGTRMRNAVDNVYQGQSGESALARLTRLDRLTVAKGYLATIVLGVDPSATPGAA